MLRAIGLVIIVLCSVVDLLSLAGCGSLPERLTSANEETRRDETRQEEGGSDEIRQDATRGSVVIQCEAVPSPDKGVMIRYQINNISTNNIHIIDNGRAPYQLARGADTLVILHGIHPPPSDRTFMFDVPRTRPLEPGDVFVGEVTWPRRFMRDHYGHELAPASLMRGTIRVRCEAGWWQTPVTEPPPFIPSGRLFESQQLVEYGPFDVTLP
jgi:hypothetical protein